MMTEQIARDRAGKIRLIALDLDGTSMNRQSRITPHTSAVFQRLVDRGYLVVPATGRRFFGLREEILHVTGIRYVISANGAIVTEAENGKQIFRELLPCETAAELTERLLRPDTCVYIHRSDPEGSHSFACGDGDFYEAHYRLPGWVGKEGLYGMEFPDVIRKEGMGVAKLGVWFENEQKMNTAAAWLRAEYPEVSTFRVVNYELELSARRASKGQALERLCGYLGISPEEVCAIGDSENDLSMITYAGLGVAMGNALESVRSQADFVAGCNDEDGAAAFFEEFFLKETPG